MIKILKNIETNVEKLRVPAIQTKVEKSGCSVMKTKKVVSKNSESTPDLKKGISATDKKPRKKPSQNDNNFSGRRRSSAVGVRPRSAAYSAKVNNDFPTEKEEIQKINAEYNFQGKTTNNTTTKKRPSACSRENSRKRSKDIFDRLW